MIWLKIGIYAWRWWCGCGSRSRWSRNRAHANRIGNVLPSQFANDNAANVSVCFAQLLPVSREPRQWMKTFHSQRKHYVVYTFAVMISSECKYITVDICCIAMRRARASFPKCLVGNRTSRPLCIGHPEWSLRPISKHSVQRISALEWNVYDSPVNRGARMQKKQQRALHCKHQTPDLHGRSRKSNWLHARVCIFRI